MKKRGVRSAESFRRKLLLAEHEIYESIEHKIKLKIRAIIVKQKNN